MRADQDRGQEKLQEKKSEKFYEILKEEVIEVIKPEGAKEKPKEEEAEEEKVQPLPAPPPGKTVSEWMIQEGMYPMGETARDTLKDISSERTIYSQGLMIKEKQLFEKEARQYGAAPGLGLETERRFPVVEFLQGVSGFTTYTPTYSSNFFHVQNDTEGFTQEVITGLRYARVGVIGLDVTASLTYLGIDIKTNPGLDKHLTPAKTRTGGVTVTYQPTGAFQVSLGGDYRKTTDVEGEDDERTRSVSADQWTGSTSLKARWILSAKDIVEFQGSVSYAEGRSKGTVKNEITEKEDIVFTVRRNVGQNARVGYTRLLTNRLLLRGFVKRSDGLSSGPGNRLRSIVEGPGVGTTFVYSRKLSFDLEVTKDKIRTPLAIKDFVVDNTVIEGLTENIGAQGGINYQFTGIPRTSLALSYKQSQFQQRTSTRVDVTKGNSTFSTETVDIAMQHTLATPAMTLMAGMNNLSTTSSALTQTLKTFRFNVERPILAQAATVSFQYRWISNRVTSTLTEQTNKDDEYDEHVFFFTTTLRFGGAKG